MYCKKCGTELRENDEFCYHCGTRTTFVQRVFSSKAVVGSLIAIILVAIAGVLTYFLMTGKWKLPERGKEPVVEKQQEQIVDQKPKATTVPTPTETPYVFQAVDVTSEAKQQMKGLLGRVKPFLGYCASFYADGSHKFMWDDKTATVMAIYNLEHYDGTIRYGNDKKTIKKATQKEMKKLFGTNYKYKLEYGERFPLYVYRPTGNTIVFNATRIPGKEPGMQTKKVVEYEEGKYRVVVDAYLKSVYTGQKRDVQRYTLFVDKQTESDYGYVVRKIRLYRRKDMEISG